MAQQVYIPPTPSEPQGPPKPTKSQRKKNRQRQQVHQQARADFAQPVQYSSQSPMQQSPQQWQQPSGAGGKTRRKQKRQRDNRAAGQQLQQEAGGYAEQPMHGQQAPAQYYQQPQQPTQQTFAQSATVPNVQSKTKQRQRLSVPKLPLLRRKQRADAEPRHRKRKIVFIVMMVLAVGFCTSGYMVNRAMAGEAVGTVVLTDPSQIQKPAVELEQFDGTLFSFVHPMTFINQNVKPQPGVSQLESHSFLSSGMTGEYLTTVVTKMPDSNLNDESSYAMRVQDPKKYLKKVMVVKNEQVTVFTSDDGTQYMQTAFWPHAGKLLTMTLTGMSGDTDTAKAEYTAMVQSISWH